MRSRWRSIALTAACLAASSAALAEGREVTLDPGASRVTFTLGTTFHEVHGTLALEAGAIRFDPATGEASGEIVVDARRAETGNDRRDAKMHADVLESKLFPQMVFRPQRVEGTLAAPGRSALRLVGVMSLHGSDHPLTVPLAVEVEGERLRAQGSFPIPYVAWGMLDPSAFIVRAEKFVEVTVQVEGKILPGPPSGKGAPPR